MGSLYKRAIAGFNLVLAQLGARHSDGRLAADAQRFWAESSEPSELHCRRNTVFSEDRWWDVGREHLAMFERLRGGPGGDPLGRVVEWGCGGGANAVHFAPRATEFIGVDVVSGALEECSRQVDAVCATPFRPVLASVTESEDAAAGIPPCDLFVCTYVIKAAPTPEYGLRLMHLAQRLLADDGLVFVQIKYRSREWRSSPRRRGYGRVTHANMTTYRIEEFWTAVQDCGLRPETMLLVPRNDLDERYAYLLLRKPPAA